jgi:hypothetical protein
MSDGVNGRIPNFKRNSGSDDDIRTLLAMRSNIVNYVHLIDIYAPCVVKSSIWNRDAIMTQYCGDNASNFHEYILSISDEAFLLLVLLNYSATWMAEIEEEHRKVRLELILCVPCYSIIPRNCSQQASCAKDLRHPTGPQFGDRQSTCACGTLFTFYSVVFTNALVINLPLTTDFAFVLGAKVYVFKKNKTLRGNTQNGDRTTWYWMVGNRFGKVQ